MNDLPLYQVVDWDKWFENAKSRTVTRPQFVCVPNKHGGTGLSNIQGEHDGAAIYGIWMWVLQVCSRQGPKREGYLTADGKKSGRRLGARELANMFRRPIEEIHRAFQVLQSDEVAFIQLLSGHPEFTTRIPDGYHADTSVSAEGTEVSKNDATLEGYLADTTRIPSDHLSKPSGVTERRNEEKELLSQPGDPNGEQADTTQIPDGYRADTSVSDGKTDQEQEQDGGGTPPDVIQHAEAKRLFGDLALAVFGKTIRETQWPNDLEHHLDAELPLARESWRLIDWFYRLQEDHPIMAVTMRRQSFESLIRNLGEESQKIRSARKKIGLNGLSETGDGIAESDGWTPARKKAAAELYGDRELPERFSQMPASARTEIETRISQGGEETTTA